jgi:hypothetical protein
VALTRRNLRLRATDPTNGFSHTYLTELGVPSGSVDDIRFYCTSSLHNRVIDFKTSQASILDIAYNGSGTTTSSDWTGGTTLLDDHTGNLPLATNNASGASFTGTFPFYRTNQYHWAIRGQASTQWWECDDPHVASHDTHHQIWFR